MTAGHTITTETNGQRVQVVVAGATIADTTRAVVLRETGLPARYYVPRADIATNLLVPTPTTSNCPFKGDAVYFSARVGDTLVPDIAWSYPNPIPDRADITGLVCFFDERVDRISVDGEQVARPITPWSAAADTSAPPA